MRVASDVKLLYDPQTGIADTDTDSLLIIQELVRIKGEYEQLLTVAAPSARDLASETSRALSPGANRPQKQVQNVQNVQHKTSFI